MARGEGLRFVHTMTTAEQEMCETVRGLFDTPSEKLKPQYNEAILFLQYCKLVRYSDESAEQWIGKLRTSLSIERK